MRMRITYIARRFNYQELAYSICSSSVSTPGQWDYWITGGDIPTPSTGSVYGLKYFSDATAFNGPSNVLSLRNDNMRCQAYGTNLIYSSLRGEGASFNNALTGISYAAQMGNSAIYIVNAQAAKAVITAPTPAILSTTDDCEFRCTCDQ